MKRRAITTILALTVATVTSLSVHSRQVKALGIPQVTLLRTPHEGIQPQTVLGRDGVLHMIYFKGDAATGDIEYVRRGRREGLLSTDSRKQRARKRRGDWRGARATNSGGAQRASLRDLVWFTGALWRFLGNDAGVLFTLEQLRQGSWCSSSRPLEEPVHEAKQMTTAQAVGAASHTPGGFSTAVRIGSKPVSSRPYSFLGARAG